MECRQENRGYKLQTCFGRNLAGFPLDCTPTTFSSDFTWKGDKWREIKEQSVCFNKMTRSFPFSSCTHLAVGVTGFLGWILSCLDTTDTWPIFNTLLGTKSQSQTLSFHTRQRRYPTVGSICTTSSRQLSANNRGFSNCKADAEKLQMTCVGHWVNVTQSAQTSTCTTRGSTRCQADW